MAALTQTTDGPRLGEQEMKKMSPASFHPTLWGDFFLSYEAPTETQEAQMREKAGVLKEEVRNMIKGSHDMPEIVDLIITLQRLNLDYHYEDEITEKLTVVYNSNYDGGNLDLVSRQFYLLRKCGYHVSSDVFLNFKDQYGNFIGADTRSLLSLYNAAYLRIHGETVLDEAISFTTRCLQDRLEHLESPIAEEVSSALDTPLFRRVGTLEIKDYIPIYEKDAKQNKSILEFAKLNFNLLQLLYSSELKECTSWWKELRVESNLSFVRDRIVEVYFWMSGGCYDPQYSHSRIILTKIVAFITILDDTLDSHANSYESMQLAKAVERWDETAVSLLPEYMKDFYMYLLKTFSSFENELGPDKSYRVFYLKEAVKELVREYTKEIKWRDEDYVPKTLKEHLKVSLISIGGTLVLCSAFVGMGDVVTKKIMEWVMSDAELVKSFGIFVQLSNDIVSTKREQREKHCVSTVQCYMKQHELTMDEACEQIKELIEDSWKFMIEQGLALKEYPIIVPRTVLEFARTVDYMYKEADKYTVSHTIKDMLTSLYVKPVLM
ncbi:(S)-beta-macrocarpene synthase-like [Zea mays]|uniref:Alpha-humulene/(-)-(E)-beta-caryophyllene synthase n=2 Tax=Zea mays TaxID=4577 RepID=K7TKS3_MAIZE|nr:(S)-beta-macrocarpene synthase-like [Zea mays]AQK40807.1 Alpha-humulene/(-)-(E)-beta-caryophyllene synthase [Zea mays]AQK40808.1 Alpha-humulene/(-)-(E)-beta-caryophyllene synthase [Zea mays]|eukprot:XP_008662701.1 (S)-beta-macrocarpene synthase-like [Zea mays]